MRFTRICATCASNFARESFLKKTTKKSSSRSKWKLPESLRTWTVTPAAFPPPPPARRLQRGIVHEVFSLGNFSRTVSLCWPGGQNLHSRGDRLRRRRVGSDCRHRYRHGAQRH